MPSGDRRSHRAWSGLLASLALVVPLLLPIPAGAVSDNGTAAYSALMNDYGHFFKSAGHQDLILKNDYPCTLSGQFACSNANTSWNYWWQANALQSLLDDAQRQGYEGQPSSTDLTDAEELVQGIADINSSSSQSGGMCSTNNALDRCWNDDMAWMGLSVLRLWDMTSTSTYLNDAEGLFNQIYSTYGVCSSPGVPWQYSGGNNCQKNTAANATSAILGAELYVRTGNTTYLNDAENLMSFMMTYLVQSNGEVQDTVTFNSNGTVGSVSDTSGGWTYNQGTLIGAGAALYLAEFAANRGGNYGQYLTDAQNTMNYVLTEWPTVLPKGGANGGCGYGTGGGQGDCGLFNGILIRYAQALSQLDGDHTALHNWLQSNASKAYQCAQSGNLYGPDWTCNTGNASTYEPLDLSTNLSGVYVENVSQFLGSGIADYEGEDGIHTAGVYQNATGYSGWGFIGGWNTAGQYDEVAPYVHSAGTYTLTFRYSAATGAASRNLYVNGTLIGTVSFAGTSSWSSWQTVSTNVSLNAGTNTVELEDSDGIYLNIDDYQLTCASGCTTY